jgi:Na+/phosphate symporter
VEPKTTSWVVVGVGAVVSLIGQMSRPGELGSGILGFGLAHIVLGLLDMLRPTVRQNS